MNKYVFVLLVALAACGTQEVQKEKTTTLATPHTKIPTPDEVIDFVGGGQFTTSFNGIYEESILNESNKFGNQLGFYYSVIWNDGVWQIDDNGSQFSCEINIIVSRGEVIGAVIKNND